MIEAYLKDQVEPRDHLPTAVVHPLDLKLGVGRIVPHHPRPRARPGG